MRPFLGFSLCLVLLVGCSSNDIVEPEPEPEPTVSFVQSELVASESAGSVDVVVRRVGASADPVSVTLRLDTDESTASSSDLGEFDEVRVTIPAGESAEASESVTLVLTRDGVAEEDEVAVLVLEDPADATLGTPARLDLTIADPIDYASIDTPEFTAHVQPFLTENCASCHGGPTPEAGLDVTSWTALLDGSDEGEALIAFDSANSLMIELATKLPAEHDLYAAHRLGEAEVAFLRRWIDQGAKGPDGEVPFADISNRLYVCNQMAGQVSIIDLDRLVVARNVKFDAYGGPMETNPHDVDVEPDGSRWYVSLINAHGVLQYDAATNEVTAEADLGDGFKPGMLALDAANGRIFAGRSFSDLSGGQSIFSIQRDGMVPTEVPVPYTRPHPIAVNNAGTHLLSGSLADNVLASFDLTNPDDIEQADLLTVGGTEKAFVHYTVSPDGGVAAVTSQLSQELYFVDISDPRNLSILGIAAVGNQPWHPTYSPDGSRVYVPNRLSNTVSVVDATDPSAPAVVATIADDRFAMPHGSAITDDGRYLFVSSRNQQFEDGSVRYTPRYPLGDNMMVGHVAVIDTQTNTVVKVIEVEEFASGMVVHQE